MSQHTKTIVAILHNIRSAHNVGSIFRTADAAGVSKVYLTGYTPAPKDRFGRVVKEIAKTALGAESFIPWEVFLRPQIVFQKLKKEGFMICAIEQSKRSIPYLSFRTKKPIALLVGNEVAGLSPAILSQVDHTLEIPMHGKKESLNVGVAFGIVVFALSEGN